MISTGQVLGAGLGALGLSARDRAEERFEAVDVRLGPQVAARVDDRCGQRRRRLARIDGAKPAASARNASTTPSFSSGSLEQVA